MMHVFFVRAVLADIDRRELTRYERSVVKRDMIWRVLWAMIAHPLGWPDDRRRLRTAIAAAVDRVIARRVAPMRKLRGPLN